MIACWDHWEQQCIGAQLPDCNDGSWYPTTAELLKFCTDMERAVIRTVEEGHMTKDLAICVHGTTKVGLPWYEKGMLVRGIRHVTSTSHPTVPWTVHFSC